MTTKVRNDIIGESRGIKSDIALYEAQEDWQAPIRVRVKAYIDNIVLKRKDRAIDTLLFLKMKRYPVQSERQAFWFQWKTSQSHESTLQQIQRYYAYFYPTLETIKTPIRQVTGTKPISISYDNKEAVERLLNHTGSQVLNEIISVISKSSRENDWPLDKIVIRYVKDSEVKNWEYILILIYFASDFDTADGYLHDLYKELDILSEQLSEEQKDKFLKLFYYDVATTAVSTA